MSCNWLFFQDCFERKVKRQKLCLTWRYSETQLTDMQNTSKRKVGAEILDMYHSLSHRYLWPFQLCFEHTMAVSWQECHCNNSPHYLALFIKQNLSKLSNLMVLDKNNVTTNRGRKAFSYLQKDEAIWRLFIHPDITKSTQLNFFASWWNPCTLYTG